MATSHVVASHITKLLSSFRQILEFRFRENQQERIPPWKVTKTKPFLSTCYGDPSATEVPPCCEAATNKLTFSTTSVLLLLDVPYVMNPEGQYHTVPNHNDVLVSSSRRADDITRERRREGLG